MTASTDADADLEALLRYLQAARGFDFTGYKRSTLGRRVAKRLAEVDVGGFGEYVDYLEVHPDEFERLFNTILINVTSFFRDPAAWDYLREEALPQILAAKASDSPIRVWSAACATGEEAYSIAMMLAEAIGDDGFRARVKVYATDVDEEALAVARRGEYGPQALNDLPPPLVERYFNPVDGNYAFRGDLRRSIILGRHDLLQDAPISRLDLLVCRNALMYFNAEAQRRVLARFHFALNDSGRLFLGKAEMLLTHANLFLPVNLRHRVFSKAVTPGLGDQLLMLADNGGDGEAAAGLAHDIRLREMAFDEVSVGHVVVDRNGSVVLANRAARRLLNLSGPDEGRPLQDLELSYRPVELRGPIGQAYETRRIVSLPPVERPTRVGGTEVLRITIVPLFDDDGSALGVNVVFEDVSEYRRLQDHLERSNHELETASEELQSTNEELETANEELQSTIEELETTNEELQSANEELETMNEELESTNEELQTINDELRDRTEDYDRVNAYLSTILGSIHHGVVVVDSELLVHTWNRRAEDMWGLREDEVEGQPLDRLDVGFPVKELGDAARACIDGRERVVEVEVQAVNRRGREITCRVACTPLVDGARTRGAVLLMQMLPG